MEKLVYALFGEVSESPAAIASGLSELGARGITVNVSDAHVKSKLGSRITRLDPTLGGIVSFWLESARDRQALERALASTSTRLAGYSVLESVALSNRTHLAAPSERTPGINMIACIEPRTGLPYEAWLEYWLEEHRRVALEVQASYAYVRNIVVRALTPGAPQWKGIVEEGFDADAVGDPMAWYKAGGSKQKLSANVGRMIASCRKFLDLERVESHPFSEYRFER